MIPLRDAIPSRNFPVTNTVIIALNVLVFLWEMMQGPRLEEAFFLFGVVPARYSDPQLASHFTMAQQWAPFLTSMFLHGGFLHIIGNMWFLYIFGDNIEDRLGHIRYLLFYLLCGILAGMVHLLTNWESRIPTVGASGAISGVMGAYLVLHPRARILTLIPIFFFIQFFEIPAFVFLGYWFLLQLLSAGSGRAEVGGVAFWAHIGGFVSGIVLLKLFDVIPRRGVTEKLTRYTERRATPRVQPVRRVRTAGDLDLQGTVTISRTEALRGTRKVISIPEGWLKKRTHLVTIPPGVEDGTRLNLSGLGRLGPGGERGDLYLQVNVSD
jgi:membrane associated rhomboid family serine protease